MEILEKFLDEFEHLKEARELLEKVYIEIGPYNDGGLSEETLMRLRAFFEFDDSE